MNYLIVASLVDPSDVAMMEARETVTERLLVSGRPLAEAVTLATQFWNEHGLVVVKYEAVEASCTHPEGLTAKIPIGDGVFGLGCPTCEVFLYEVLVS